MDRSGHWVHTWAAVPQLAEPGDLPPVPFVGAGRAFVDATLRQTLRVSVGGTRPRLRLSNAYGAAPLSVGGVGVALPAGGRAGACGIQPGSGRRVRRGDHLHRNPAGCAALADTVPASLFRYPHLPVPKVSD